MQPLWRWHGTAVGHMDTVLTMWACRISHILWQAGEVLKGMAANSGDTVRAVFGHCRCPTFAVLAHSTLLANHCHVAICSSQLRLEKSSFFSTMSECASRLISTLTQLQLWQHTNNVRKPTAIGDQCFQKPPSTAHAVMVVGSKHATTTCTGQNKGSSGQKQRLFWTKTKACRRLHVLAANFQELISRSLAPLTIFVCFGFFLAEGRPKDSGSVKIWTK
jgi:hypothetical protein